MEDVPSRRVGQVTEAINRLDDLINRLAATSEALVHQLSPIRQVQPTKGTESAAVLRSTGMAPLAEALQEHCSRLEANIDGLRQVAEELQI